MSNPSDPEWRRLMKPHRLQLHQLGVPPAVYESRRAWGYFLDHGDLPSPIPGGGMVFSISSMTEHDRRQLRQLILALPPSASYSRPTEPALAEDEAGSEPRPSRRRRRGRTTR